MRFVSPFCRALSVCIYSFAALSPATREEERLFHLLKEEEEEERALIVSRVSAFCGR